MSVPKNRRRQGTRPGPASALGPNESPGRGKRPAAPGPSRAKIRTPRAGASRAFTGLPAPEVDEILGALSDPIFIFGPNGELRDANAAALSLLGGRAAFVPGTAFKDLISGVSLIFPTGRAVPPEAIGSASALLGLPRKQCFLLRCPDGVKLNIEAEASPLWRDGSLAGAVEVWKDVTERSELLADVSRDRLQFETHLRERMLDLSVLSKTLRWNAAERRRLSESGRQAQDLLARIFDGSGLYIAFLDSTFHYLQVNQAFAQAAGQTEAGFVGLNHFDLFPDPYLRTIFSGVIAGGKPHVGHEREFFRPARKGMTAMYWDWSVQAAPVRGGDTGLILILIDVTRRRRAEAARRLLASAIDQAQEPVILLNAHGAIQYANSAFQRLTGLAEESFLGRTYPELAGRGLNRELFQGALAHALRSGESWRGRVVRRVPSGREAILDILLTPLRDEHFRLANISVIERDVTREVIEEEKRGRINRARLESLGRLAGGIAHDFNNLLLPIMLNTEALLGDAEAESPLRPHLKNILQAAQRAKGLVDQILVFSRESASSRGFYFLQPVVRETLELVRDILPSNVTFRSVLDAPRAATVLTPTQVNQVLMNLCANAIHAMRSRGGTLEVSLVNVDAPPGPRHAAPRSSGESGFARLTVSDTGEGMSRDVLDKIFDPFFTTKGPGQGSGMGLAVVHGIVEAGKGTIRIKSEPDRGTAFDIYLPLLKRPGRTAEAESIRGRESILLLEGERTIASIVKEMLEGAGFRVTSETDPGEALRLYGERPAGYDLVIADQTLPRGTGARVAKEILALRPGQPILLALDRDEQEPDASGIEGVRGFIRKPYSSSELIKLVRRTLDTPPR